MTIWLVLKLVGSVIALAYGIYATVVDFHTGNDADKRLSVGGKIGLVSCPG